MIKRGLIALLLSGGVVACEPSGDSQQAVAPPIAVRVVTVRRGEIASTIAVTGETAALTVLRLASPVAGRVTVLAVQAGDRLEKEAVAARVVPLENEAALHGFSILENAGDLSGSEKQGARRLAQDLRAHDIPLRVPFAAIVADRLHNPGEQVAASEVLLELFDPASLYVVAQVPVHGAAAVRVGMPVEISAGGADAPGQVAAVLSAVTPQALTVPVRISLAAPLKPPLLRAAVQCRITLASHADTLLIPRSALLSSTVADRGVVMVAIGNRAQQRTVQLGFRTLDEVEVTDGLVAGDVVLATGQYSIPDGTTIDPRPVE